MSFRRKVRSSKCPSPKCPFSKMSFDKVSLHGQNVCVLELNIGCNIKIAALSSRILYMLQRNLFINSFAGKMKLVIEIFEFENYGIFYSQILVDPTFLNQICSQICELQPVLPVLVFLFVYMQI